MNLNNPAPCRATLFDWGDCPPMGQVVPMALPLNQILPNPDK